VRKVRNATISIIIPHTTYEIMTEKIVYGVEN